MNNLDPAIFGETRKTCTVKGCDRNYHSKGYCYTHRMRAKRGLPLDAPIHQRRRKDQLPRACSVTGCHAEALSRGYCNAHYHRARAGGDLLKPVVRRVSTDATRDLAVRLPKTLDGELRQQAARMHLTRSGLVRLILDAWAKDVTARRRENAQ